MKKAELFLRERWWLILFIAVVAILLLIPTKTGLPDQNYNGCINTDPKYKSYCLTTNIKSVSRDTSGSTSITVPVTFSDGTDDITFQLKGDRGLKVNDAVFINLTEWNKRAYLFIDADSNMLVTILNKVFSGSQGVTAIIDLNTLKEI
jgi:hypothetical protein